MKSNRWLSVFASALLFVACGGGEEEDKPNPADSDGGVVVVPDGGDIGHTGCKNNDDCTDPRVPLCNVATGKCYSDVAPGCGNDQIDPGEECDGTENCDENCHLKADEVIGDDLSCEGTDNCCISGSGSKTMIRGDILAGEKVIKGGSVLIGSNGKIECVGTDCSSDGATVITCPSAVVSPSFINAHEHITYGAARPDSWGDERFDHRNDWRKDKNGHTNHNGQSTNNNEVAEIRMIMGGATSIFGSGIVKGMMRNIDKKDHTEGLSSKPAAYDTFPLGDSGGTQVSLGGGCSQYKPSDAAKDAENDLSCAYGPHVAEGINSYALNELYCVSGQEGSALNLFQPHSAFIHGVGATPDYIAMMAQSGVKLIWSPRSNISLYGDTAMVTTYDTLGVTIGLGTDWIYSGSMNMLRELQCVDGLNKNNFGGYFSDKKIWKMATINNAVALGVDSELGELKAGKWADIAVFKKYPNRTDYRAVIDAEPQDVLLVMRGGQKLYGDANLINDSGCYAVKGTTLKGQAYDTVCGTAKKICLLGTSLNYGKALDLVHSKTNGTKNKNIDTSYEFFFCGVPDDEPTCVPQRKRATDLTGNKMATWTGVPTAGDRDGDGISDSEDNCPDVFNPVRPNDDKNSALGQDDYDGDGIGDACDAYPTCADNNVTCGDSVVDPSQRDSDGDGVIDREDNCPADANPNQDDADKDGHGDVCDECPNAPNPGDTRCPIEVETKIADIWSGSVGNVFTKCPVPQTGNCNTNVEVMVKGTVTAVSPKGVFIQDPTIANGKHAAIYAYTGKTIAGLSIGDQVQAQGFIGTYYDQLELLGTVSVNKISEGTPIEPVKVSVADVNTLASDYNSSLVTISDVEVTTLPDSNKVFQVTDGTDVVEIDDLMGYAVTPEVDQAYESITGIVLYDFGSSKVSPRNGADMVAGAAKARLSSLVCPERIREKTTGKCTVSLAKAVETDTAVQLNAEGGVAVQARSVSIEAGKTEVSFEVEANDSGAKTSKVKVTLNKQELTQLITVVQADARPSKIDIEGPSTITLNGTADLTLKLDAPHKADLSFNVTADDECITVSTPAVTFPAETITQTVTLTATNCEADKEIKVSAVPDVESGIAEGHLKITVTAFVPETKIETFDDSNRTDPKPDSYSDGNFISTVTGVAWHYTKGRTDENEYAINGDGLMFKSGTLTGQIEGGIGNVSVDMMAAFGNTSKIRTVKIYVDDVECGSGTAKAASEGVKTVTCSNVNKAGTVSLKVEAISDNQVIIDNLTWTTHQ